MKLYWSPISAPSRSIKFFLEYNNILHEIETIDFLKGEQWKHDFLEINPNHSVPVINDNGFILYESSAIFRYLYAKYLNNKNNQENLINWYPDDIKKRAIVNEYLDWHHNYLRKASYSCAKISIFHRLQTPSEINFNKLSFENEHKLLETSLKNIEQRLEKNEWITGNEITFADIQAACEILNTKLWRENLNNYPKISEWLNRIEKLPKWNEVNKEFNNF